MHNWLESGLGEAEIEEARKGYAEAWKAQLASDSYLVSQLLADLRQGRSIEFHQTVVDAASDLTSDDLRAALEVFDGSAFVDMVGGDVAKFGSE